MDLFPETLGEAPVPVKYESADVLDKWGSPRVTVRLLPSWDEGTGWWRCGWFCLIDKALDEHLPQKVTPPNYPWYRPEDFPQSRSLDVAKAIAARAVKIVMEQMVGYVETDIWPAVRETQGQIEQDAQRWLGARPA